MSASLVQDSVKCHIDIIYFLQVSAQFPDMKRNFGAFCCRYSVEFLFQLMPSSALCAIPAEVALDSGSDMMIQNSQHRFFSRTGFELSLKREYGSAGCVLLRHEVDVLF